MPTTIATVVVAEPPPALSSGTVGIVRGEVDAGRLSGPPLRSDTSTLLLAVADARSVDRWLTMNRWSRQRGAMLTLVVIAVLIAGFVYALLQPRWSERPIAEVNAAVDSSRLAVTVHHNECGNVGPRVRVVSESEESVVLSAEQNERGGCADIGLTSVVAVDLDAPLGSRDLLFDPEDTSNSVRCLIDGQRIEQCG